MIDEYEQRTYEDLSKEFQELYPAAARAFELIPLMYNRLTLVDGQTHKVAIKKILTDHQNLSGFSARNIRRYLPSDNPTIPRRIRSSWPKNSDNHTSTNEKLSSNEQSPESPPYQSDSSYEPDRERIERENHQMKEQVANLQELHEQDTKTIGELNDALSRTAMKTADEIAKTESGRGIIIDFEFSLPWEVVRKYMNETYKSGRSLEVWFNGRIDKESGNIIVVYTGKVIDRLINERVNFRNIEVK
jgi:hypothetical protein